jgi:hypothetical protein
VTFDFIQRRNNPAFTFGDIIHQPSFILLCYDCAKYSTQNESLFCILFHTLAKDVKKCAPIGRNWQNPMINMRFAK